MGSAHAAGVPQKLKGLLEAHGMLGSAVRGLNAVNKRAHLALGLTGGRRQEALVALIQGTGPNRISHRQH